MAKPKVDLEKERAKSKANVSGKGPAPVLVDSTARASLGGASTPMEGHFAVVVSGDHEGRYGVFEAVATRDDDGLPETVSFRTRDDESETLTVDFADLEAAEAGRR